TWKITSKSGIGGVSVSLKEGQAPKKIVIRFAGMQTLESLQVQASDLKLSGQLRRDGKSEFHFDEKGKPGADPKKAAVALLIQKKDAGTAVPLEARKRGKKWNLSWVDAYGRGAASGRQPPRSAGL